MKPFVLALCLVSACFAGCRVNVQPQPAKPDRIVVPVPSGPRPVIIPVPRIPHHQADAKK